MKATIEIHDDDSITVKHGDTVVSATPPVQTAAGSTPIITYPWSNERHWREGDRRPSQGEMMLYGPLGWFDGMPNTAVDHNTDAGTPSPEVSYNEGGETKITLPRTFVTGCKGNSDFDVGPVAAGVNKTIALVAAGAGDCSGEFQAVDRSGAALTAIQQGSDPTLTFVGTGIDVVIHVRLSKPLARMAVVAQN